MIRFIQFGHDSLSIPSIITVIQWMRITTTSTEHYNSCCSNRSLCQQHTYTITAHGTNSDGCNKAALPLHRRRLQALIIDTCIYGIGTCRDSGCCCQGTVSGKKICQYHWGYASLSFVNLATNPIKGVGQKSAEFWNSTKMKFHKLYVSEIIQGQKHVCL